MSVGYRVALTKFKEHKYLRIFRFKGETVNINKPGCLLTKQRDNRDSVIAVSAGWVSNKFAERRHAAAVDSSSAFTLTALTDSNLTSLLKLRLSDSQVLVFTNELELL